MCAVRRAGGNAPMNQAHSTEGFADDNGGWGYFEEEYEGEDEGEQSPQHHEERAQQQKARADEFAESGLLPELAIVEQGAPVQHELLAQVPERERPHRPEPTGTAQLAASSESATYKRNWGRRIDRSHLLRPEPSLQLRPETILPPQPTHPDDMPSILRPPPMVSHPAHPTEEQVSAAAHATPAAAPAPASPWSIAPAHVDEEGQPLPGSIPSSPHDVTFGRDPYSALKKLKAPKNAAATSTPEPFWPSQEPFDPDSLPHHIKAIFPPTAPPPPTPRQQPPPARFLSASGKPATPHAPAPRLAPIDHHIDELEATIGGPGSVLMVSDDFFDQMAAQTPQPTPHIPAKPRPRLDLDDALGHFDLAAIEEDGLLDIGLLGGGVDGDTMFAGNADALLQEAAAELAAGGWADEPFDMQSDMQSDIQSSMQSSPQGNLQNKLQGHPQSEGQSDGQIDAQMLSLEHMPLGGHSDPLEDNLDATMMGDIEGLDFDNFDPFATVENSDKHDK